MSEKLERRVEFCLGAMRRVLTTLETGDVEHLQFHKPKKTMMIIDTNDPSQRVWDGVVDELKQSITLVANKRV